jgi:Protein of unknown function (DUF499)
MALKPWYRVSRPHEDLRQRHPLDAGQFAVHLDKVASGDAPPDYANAERFFARTKLTEGLRRFASEVLRRLDGQTQGANAVHNLVTQFGGGKTHALTLLYHLAKLGPDAAMLPDVPELLRAAAIERVPRAVVAVFVGTDWDAVTGRTSDGVHRRTPWGDIAWQLAVQAGDHSLYEAIAQQDEARVRPGKEMIRKMLPPDRPVLILMDEVMNFMTAARAIPVGSSTLASQFYDFIHTLTEEADSPGRMVVVVSLPASEQEMSAEDEQDFKRLAKITTRVAEPYALSHDLEIPEIVRRRLFEDVGDSAAVRDTARAYARWAQDHREQIPRWFSTDRAQNIVEATYPFHPTVLSVFERKWQSLPSFQRTRGVLRLLAQWVADAYEDGFQYNLTDPLIALGTAPLDDQFFRTAVLDQLGEERLVAPILSDIAGQEAHAEKLDEHAPETLRHARIHRKVATAAFFESSGGQARHEATVPELRLAVGEPDLDIGNVETALDALADVAYYLVRDPAGCHFSTKENLNRKLADRRVALGSEDVEDKARAVIRQAFTKSTGVDTPIEPEFFPAESSKIRNIPALQLVVLEPTQTHNAETQRFIEHATTYCGGAARDFKNSLIWVVPAADATVLDEARNALAWESIEDEPGTQELDETQQRAIANSKRDGLRDLGDAVWQSYRILVFLDSDGNLHTEDLGVGHVSTAGSLQALIQSRLRQRDELTDSLAPARIVQNWPRGLEEWTTKSVRDTAYASPAFTRLLRPDSLRQTIADGVEERDFGYATKRGDEYVSVKFGDRLHPSAIEFSDDIVLVSRTLAEQLQQAQPTPEAPVPVLTPVDEPTASTPATQPPPQSGTLRRGSVAALRWSGDVPPQKWTTFYMKVLARLASSGGLVTRVEFEARPGSGLSSETIDEVRDRLRELGLSIDIDTEPTEQ